MVSAVILFVLLIGLLSLKVTDSISIKDSVDDFATLKEVQEVQGSDSVKMENEWPTAVGKDVLTVVQEIKAANPALQVVKVEEGSPVTMDFRTDRVRVFYDAGSNTVVGTPKIG